MPTALSRQVFAAGFFRQVATEYPVASILIEDEMRSTSGETRATSGRKSRFQSNVAELRSTNGLLKISPDSFDESLNLPLRICLGAVADSTADQCCTTLFCRPAGILLASCFPYRPLSSLLQSGLSSLLPIHPELRCFPGHHNR
jgi:hypothetical protein